MKCPKCGYHSFDHLDNCKKCNADLVEHKAKFNLRGFFYPTQAPTEAAEPVIEGMDDPVEEVEETADGSVDFGFDFLDEDEEVDGRTSDITLGNDEQDVNIDQPFGADSETIPADPFDLDDDDKPGKGPEFAF